MMPALHGCRVLITRPAVQAASWRKAIERAGGLALLHPTIEIVAPPSWQPLDDALAEIDAYDWLVFTSANAVRMTCTRLLARAKPWAGRPRVAAVGAQTAQAVLDAGLPLDLVPAEQRQEGLIAAFSCLSGGVRVLFPQALGGRDELARTLRSRGARVDVVPVSLSSPVANPGPLPAFDVATFASPSAFAAFVAHHGANPLMGKLICAVGPTTATAIQAQGLQAEAAATPDIDAVIQTIARALARLSPRKQGDP